MGQSLEHYLMNLQKSDMEYNALIFGEKIPMSWNKEKMSRRLAEIYEQNINEFLSICCFSSKKYTKKGITEKSMHMTMTRPTTFWLTSFAISLNHGGLLNTMLA